MSFKLNKYTYPLMAPAVTGGGAGGGAGVGPGVPGAGTGGASASSVAGELRDGLDGILKVLEDPHSAINTLVSTYLGEFTKLQDAQLAAAKSLGITAESARNLQGVYGAIVSNGLAFDFGLNEGDLFKFQQALSLKTGRNISFNEETATDFGALTTLLGSPEDVAEYLNKMDLFAQNATDAAEYIGEIYKKSGQYGLSFKKYSDNFINNLKLAQKYNFKDGLIGLEKMAKKATELRLDMAAVDSVASKMWTGKIDDVIEMSSRLQTLGGTFAQFSNPLEMLNEGLNDIGGLQNRIVDMFGNLGSFNRETGEVEISTYNKMRVREAASAMGISPEQMLEMIQTSARRNEISSELEGSSLSDDLKEKLQNIGTFVGGQAGATIGGKFRSLDEIEASNELQRELLRESVSQEENVRDIASNVRSILQHIEGQGSAQESIMAKAQEDAGYLVGDLLQNTIYRNVVNTISWGSTGLKAVDNTISKFPSGNGSFIPTFGTGGILEGESHANGGVPILAEGGEYVVNKESTKEYYPLIDAINRANKPYSDIQLKSFSANNVFGGGGDVISNNNIFNKPNDIIKPSENNFSNVPVNSSNVYTNTTSSSVYNNTHNNVLPELKVNGQVDVNLKSDGLKIGDEKISGIDIWNAMSNTDKAKILAEITSLKTY